MFNEREALKTRLEQLVSMEEKIVNLYREERNEIFSRLRELDNLDRKIPLGNGFKSTSKDLDITDRNENHLENITNVRKQQNIEGFLKPRYSKKTEILRDATVDILKKHNVAIPLKQLKYEIETETGVEISNMSLFMTKLVKSEETIQKAKHGQYMYIKNLIG